MDSTATAKSGVVRNADAAFGEVNSPASLLVAAAAALSLGNATSKVSRTLAAATVSVTASNGTPALSATLERSPTFTSGVKSSTLPATTISVVSTAAVGGSGGGETKGGGEAGIADPVRKTAAAAPLSPRPRTHMRAPK